MGADLLLDTGGLVCLLDRSQPAHTACASFLRGWRGNVLTTEAVLTEATHLLGRLRGGRAVCLRFVVDGGAVLVPGTLESVARAETLVRKYADLPLDYADATLVVLAEDVGTVDVLTLDRRCFATVRWGKNRPFRVHPRQA